MAVISLLGQLIADVLYNQLGTLFTNKATDLSDKALRVMVELGKNRWLYLGQYRCHRTAGQVGLVCHLPDKVIFDGRLHMGAVLLMVSLHFFKALALFECVLVNVVLLFGGFDDIGQWQNKMIVTLG